MDNWSNGMQPDAMMDALIAVPAIVRIPYSTTPLKAGSLIFADESGLSILELNDDAVLQLSYGLGMAAQTVLRGSGVLDLGTTALDVPAGGELNAGAGASNNKKEAWNFPVVVAPT